ncbi:hypothetical protein HPB51_001576 [Rhipicephalus microplus]|uniref:Uncharacterized protein n=1 Tax=Rhipicephalus microplus TaxID=6941 RepID=A0A9J6D3U0_RHIMP|nr:hypothetical protein HPB51_001576 [Rhipicephalus microplus]
MYEPENLEFHMNLPDYELEDNRMASCPAPDSITTAAPSRAQTPTSGPSDVAAAGPQRHAEATYALIEARCDRDTAIENRCLQLEVDRLQFEIKRREQEMKLKEMELQQRQVEQEANFKLKKLELQQRRQDLEVSQASQSKVRTGPQPSIDCYLGTPASTTSTPDLVAKTSTPASDHDHKVEDAPTATYLRSERYIPSEPPCAASSHVPATCTSSLTLTAHDTVALSDSTTTTWLDASEFGADILPPAIHLPVAEPSPSPMSEGNSLPASTLWASCQQQPESPSQSPAAKV